MRAAFTTLALLLVLAARPGGAVQPSEMLDDPALEARARALSTGIRCLVCQNQSIDDSNADLARDLRLIVRERLVAGDSDQEVRDYLVARYGDFVLLKPPVKPTTYLLYFGPPGLLLMALALGWLTLRRRRPVAGAAGSELTAEERDALERILGDRDRA